MYKQFRELEQGEFIVVACDTASGGGDYSAAQFMSKKHYDVPIVYHSSKTTTYMTNSIVDVLNDIYDKTGVKPVVAYERNNGGVFEINRLIQLNKEQKYTVYVEKPMVGNLDTGQATKYGWTTSSITRPKMLEDLKHAIDEQLIRIYDETTVNEMFSFVQSQTERSWRAEAAPHAHDDLVMSLAIAFQMFQSEEKPNVHNNTFIPQNNFNKYRIK